MILKAFTIYDSKAESYLQPFFFNTKGQAIRSFSDAVAEEGHQFRRHAQDYTLFECGEFDQSSGMFTAITPVSIGNALEFYVEKHGDQLSIPKVG